MGAYQNIQEILLGISSLFSIKPFSFQFIIWIKTGDVIMVYNHYFSAADYLRLPNFSLTNWYIFTFSGKMPEFRQVCVVGSMDRTTNHHLNN